MSLFYTTHTLHNEIMSLLLLLFGAKLLCSVMIEYLLLVTVRDKIPPSLR
jgi:hypothetical protein